ncbi:MAG: hypothetical protein PF487_02455, partial [Bacteroidales bacterium]|nr:hypothetical protein [Bacteroidales bacterium]
MRSIPNSYKKKKNYLDKHSKKIETLVLGSSHASMGVFPVYFDSECYNAAMTSQAIDIDYAILNKYKDSLKTLKNIILPIDYFTLTAQMESKLESWRLKDYYIYYRLNMKIPLKYKLEILCKPIDYNLKRLYNYYILNNSEIYYSNYGNEIFEIKSNKEIDFVKTGKNAAVRQTAKNFK